MAIVTISGQPGLRADEIARDVAGRLEFELVTQTRLEGLYQSEAGVTVELPTRGYADLVTSILAPLATKHHMVFCGRGGEYLFQGFPGVLRGRLVAPAAVRAGAIMVEQNLERRAALAHLRQLERAEAAWMRPRFRARAGPVPFDLALNAASLDPASLARTIASVARSQAIEEAGLLSETAERQLQFEVRLRLARMGIAPPSAATLPVCKFAHPSEEIFAHLLDFYRIPWEYEPRSFPIQWDEAGHVVESVTPDFYLPEFDLYVEITTMKQSLVTKKNRKIKRLREIYPEVNVQVFYQKDFENLIFKYGLEKTSELLKNG